MDESPRKYSAASRTSSLSGSSQSLETASTRTSNSAGLVKAAMIFLPLILVLVTELLYRDALFDKSVD